MVDDAVRRDRRTELKQQHRDALVAAAAALLAERGPGFSVDDLAERADVARRTVFNHFATLDDVMVEVGVHELEQLLAAFERTAAEVPGGAVPHPLHDFAATLERMDLVPALARLTRMFDSDSAAGRTLLERALTMFTPRLLAEARDRAPGADPLDSELLVAQLTAGLIVLQRHWADRTGAVVSARSRAVWSELVHTLLERMRSGHPHPTPNPEASHG